MKTLALVTQKGGSGKSTLAASLAVAAGENGLRVVVLETDQQATLSDWAEARGSDNPAVRAVKPEQLAATLAGLAKAQVDLAIIDTPGVASAGTVAAIASADFCLVPSRPTIPDLKGCLPTVGAVQRADKPFAFVLTQCPAQGGRTADAARGLGMLGVLAEPPIVARSDHQDAIQAGQGVTELNPTGKAAQEVRALWTWVNGKMEGRKHGKG